MTNAEWQETLERGFDEAMIPEEPPAGAKLEIRFDFCFGLRIKIPKSVGDRKFKLTVADAKHSVRLHEAELSGGDYWVSRQRYYVDWAFKLEDATTGELIVSVRQELKDRPVVIDIPVDTLGDSIAWASALEPFRVKHGCKLYACVSKQVEELLSKANPEITFISREKKAEIFPYACYQIGVFFEDSDNAVYDLAPVDYRRCALHHYAGYILGLEPAECSQPPAIWIPEPSDKLPLPSHAYVTIASQASGMCKLWINPKGWDSVVAYLQKIGYDVYDIDLENASGGPIFWNRIPRDATDWTGELTIPERAMQITHSDFFIGLGSGLSWLAWACRKPVVLISGFSLPESEFYTPYRVINYSVCHGCYSDMRYHFENTNYTWCPRHKDTERHYECTRGIGAPAVIRQIKKLIKVETRNNITRE